MATRLYRITGRVQGVGFRAWTVETARGLALAGWVRNRLDGSVEACATGEAKTLDRFAELLHQGPRFAKVQHVEPSDDYAESSEIGVPFQQKPTV